jgi:hypothetical protein
MARRLFPSDRSALIYSSAGAPVLAPGTTTRITIYTNQACTTKANITNLQGALYSGSVIRVGSDYRIPQFLGPVDGSTVLWAKSTSGPAFRLTADYEVRLEGIESGAAAATGMPIFVGNEVPVTDAPVFIWMSQNDAGVWSYRVVNQGDLETVHPGSASFPGSSTYPHDPFVQPYYPSGDIYPS